jgi:hypothetical protein
MVSVSDQIVLASIARSVVTAAAEAKLSIHCVHTTRGQICLSRCRSSPFHINTHASTYVTHPIKPSYLATSLLHVLTTSQKQSARCMSATAYAAAGPAARRAREIEYGRMQPSRSLLLRSGENDRACTETGEPAASGSFFCAALPRETATRQGETTRRGGGGVIMVFPPGGLGGTWPSLAGPGARASLPGVLDSGWRSAVGFDLSNAHACKSKMQCNAR